MYIVDRQEYLNKISAKNKPVKKGLFNGKMSAKVIAVVGGCLGLFVLIAIIGGILGASKGSEKEKSFALKLHLDNTSQIIEKYQRLVKSPQLRSNSASLNNVLVNTNRDLTDYVTAKFNFKEKSIGKNISTEAATAKDALENDLFEAKINGMLDKVYAQKMAYEISMFVAEESSLLRTTKNAELQETLRTSIDNLENLSGFFDDYSQAN